jgi:hypothetical protein
MPLNKLDNFIKNTEGRILYVSPADLDSTDSIDNQGNSLARPFKTVQRALIEAARFSYFKGNNNDAIEKTTILLMPGDHKIDNRPGFAIKPNGSSAASAVAPSGAVTTNAQDVFGLDLNTNFDINQEDNILYKFNSVHGGVIVPRGTSIVGLDLRKTKIRPKYVPNPTENSTIAPYSAIFRVTGTCYFWQFSFFDGDENETVYTHKSSFTTKLSKPTFSHHKLTCFEYADGVNIYNDGLTDLDMYYAKLSRAFNQATGRDIDEKYPEKPDGFAPRRPEFEIVGAFAADPLTISDIISGDGAGNPTQVITVTTDLDHKLNVGTPIKIKGVGDNRYNISTKVASISSTNTKVFTYFLDVIPSDLDDNPTITGNETVTIETDTVSGASPYIFNCSLRSVWGMNGMHADGNKATGFRSMVVAQFTGISLQKDDRAFVKYDKSSRAYTAPQFSGQSSGDTLSSESSATDVNKVYHLDSGAIYRNGWETTHIKMTNDAILQVVSVFAIGYNKHFEAKSGSDASITNSNSNFGQLSLVSDGFKKEAFDKDNKAYITHIIPPRSTSTTEEQIDWLTLDVAETYTKNDNNRLYLSGFSGQEVLPPSLTQGYRIGARINDKLYIDIDDTTYSADILMCDKDGTSSTASAVKEFVSTAAGVGNTFGVTGHNFKSEEKVIMISDDGDLPENIEESNVYYAINVDSNSIALAASKNDAGIGNSISVYGGTNLRILSRVSDKESRDQGHPVQYDSTNSKFYINTNAGSEIFAKIKTYGTATDAAAAITSATYVNRIIDTRSLDERLYKLRVVVPKESVNGKTPESGFIIQESSNTGYRRGTDAIVPGGTAVTIDPSYATDGYGGFNRNLRLISTCSYNSGTITVLAEIPHNLNVSDQIIVKNVKSSDNTVGTANSGFNGTFTVSAVNSDMEFEYTSSSTAGTFTASSVDTRNESLPRFERNDLQKNLYVYRNEVISEYSSTSDENRDGIYHIYALSADYSVPSEFTDLEYGQNVVNLYPQLDRDNLDDNPRSSKSFAVRSPLGKVATNDIKKSLTRETIDKTLPVLGVGLEVSSVSTNTVTFARQHGLAGIITGALPGSIASYTDDTYYNVKLLDGSSSGPGWRGATAHVEVSGQSINIDNVHIVSAGSSYRPGETVYFDASKIGTGDGNAYLTLSSSGISSAIGDVIQFTGAGTTSDGYYRITSVDTTSSISVGRTTGDPEITSDQYGIVLGSSLDFTATTLAGVTTITTTKPHGLLSGSKFKLTDDSNNNLGDFIAASNELNTELKIHVNSTISASSGYILKHGLSANDAVSDASNENRSIRGITLYDNVTGTLSSSTDDTITVTLDNGGEPTKAFPVGTYIQIYDGDDKNDEIVLVKEISGSIVKVIRGVLGTLKASHENGSIVRRIKPLPIEFRRPSILRASGHTFEYLGYGPGNYSTGLPQVQNKTLTEREEFLSQAQERSSGIVVYTGMNNKGDFYIGNTKKSSATGEETSFDVPIPTVTGENPSRLSSVFDEVTIKERLVVEGGDSNQILSQFDGPVTFTNEIRAKGTSNFTGQVKTTNSVEINKDTASTNTSTGALVVSGGVGIGSTLNADSIISKNVKIGNADNTISATSGDLKLDADGTADNVVAIQTNTTITGILSVTDDITAFYSSDERLKDNITLIEDPLAKVVSISGNTFEWNDKSKKRGTDIGLIAQEVESLGLPGLVVTRDNGYLAVDYQKIVPLLVESIKELSSKVENLEQRLQDK